MSKKAAARRLKKAEERKAYLELLEERKANLKAIQKENRRKKLRVISKPFNERRVFTREIARNMLKFKFKEMGYQHVNKNFKAILKNIDMQEKLELLETK